MVEDTKGDPYPLTWQAPLLGVDWGESRIGLAISDPSLRFSEPVAVLKNACSFFPPFLIPPKTARHLKRICVEEAVKGIVFGVPWYHLSGDPNPRSVIFIAYGRLLRLATDLPLFFWDEGMTTDVARKLGGGRRSSRSQQTRLPVDHYSAALILQSFLDECVIASGNNTDPSGGKDGG